MKVVVTGAAGFIGHTLLKRLSADSRISELVGVDCMTDYYDVGIKRANLNSLNAEVFTFHEVDLRDCSLEEILDGASIIFHQAGQPGVRASWGQQFGDYLTNNVAVTQRLLEASTKSPSLSRFVYASSSSIYGNAPRFPTTEATLPAPLSPYGVTKLAAEQMCSLYAENFGVPTVSLRYFTVYGPRQRPDMLFARLISAVRGGEPVPIFGDGTQIRDFTHVSDIVDANLLAARTPVRNGSVYNISGGTHVSINEVIRDLGQLVGREVPLHREERTPGDAYQTGGDSSRARADLGWSPKVSLMDGLRTMLDETAFAQGISE